MTTPISIVTETAASSIRKIPLLGINVVENDKDEEGIIYPDWNRVELWKHRKRQSLTEQRETL